jgi:hypothetical protein
MTTLQTFALVSPIVLLATLTARAAAWRAKLQARIDGLERRLNEHQDDLHNIGTALRRDAN